MARQHERSGLIRFASQVIRANSLSQAELELQLDAVWKSGYQAGRKAAIRAELVAKGVASLKRMRMSSGKLGMPKMPNPSHPGKTTD
jgi:hypothetical protein